jgi:hypothetical protein
VRSYLALLGAGFRRQTTYRLALAAGLATNAFFEWCGRPSSSPCTPGATRWPAST